MTLLEFRWRFLAHHFLRCSALLPLVLSLVLVYVFWQECIVCWKADSVFGVSRLFVGTKKIHPSFLAPHVIILRVFGLTAVAAQRSF